MRRKHLVTQFIQWRPMLEKVESVCCAKMKLPPGPDGDFLPSDKAAAVAASQEGVRRSSCGDQG